jgi:hypothetical protein
VRRTPRGACGDKDGLIGAIYTTPAQSGSVQEPKAGNSLSNGVAKY